MPEDQENETPKRALSQTEPVDLKNWLAPGFRNVQLNYILYLLSFVFGVTSIIGLVFAYINRDKSDDIVESHYTYLIRTFWIGLLYFFISCVLAFIVVGFFMMFAVCIWFIIRTTKGLIAASNKEPIGNPNSWFL